MKESEEKQRSTKLEGIRVESEFFWLKEDVRQSQLRHLSVGKFRVVC